MVKRPKGQQTPKWQQKWRCKLQNEITIEGRVNNITAGTSKGGTDYINMFVLNEREVRPQSGNPFDFTMGVQVKAFGESATKAVDSRISTGDIIRVRGMLSQDRWAVDSKTKKPLPRGTKTTKSSEYQRKFFIEGSEIVIVSQKVADKEAPPKKTSKKKK